MRFPIYVRGVVQIEFYGAAVPKSAAITSSSHNQPHMTSHDRKSVDAVRTRIAGLTIQNSSL